MSIVNQFYGKNFQLIHATDQPPNPRDYSMHMHDTYEIFCFVCGNASYMVEGNTYELRPGSLLLIRNSESHMLVLKGEERYERFTLNFRRELFEKAGFSPSLLSAFHDRSLGEKNLYLPGELLGIDTVMWFRKMCDEAKVLPAEDVLTANLSSLLCAVNCAFIRKIRPSPTKNTKLGNEIIGYINENILSELSLQTIARHIHMSPSQINRVFKETTGSSVYHYILLKRLILAREMIANGESAANAALSCGFRDYSSFFRLYKKHFGTAPTAKRKLHIQEMS